MDRLEPLAVDIAALLREREETVAVVETTAGGLVSAALLAVPGASAYYRGGAVTYTGVARDTLLGLDMTQHPGVRSSSEPYARLIAAAIRERLGATWGVGETGAAGPTGNPYGDAAGHTCIAIAGPIAHSETVETGDAEREANMWRFARRTLEALAEALREAATAEDAT